MKSYTITIDEEINLEQLFKEIKQFYQELKDCSNPPIQRAIIWTLKQKCQHALQILNKSCQKSQNVSKKRQITDVRNKIEILQKQIIEKEKVKPEIGNGGREALLNYNKNYKQADLQAELSHQINKNDLLRDQQSQKVNPSQTHEQKSRQYFKASQISSRDSMRILRSIALLQMQSVNLKYEASELDEVLGRLKNNQQVMQRIESMIVQQGNNLDQVQKNIQKVYSNVQAMNEQLQKAQVQQIKSISIVRNAFHHSAKSVWGFLSWPFRKIFKRRSKQNFKKQQQGKPSKNEVGVKETLTPTPL